MSTAVTKPNQALVGSENGDFSDFRVWGERCRSFIVDSLQGKPGTRSPYEKQCKHSVESKLADQVTTSMFEITPKWAIRKSHAQIRLRYHWDDTTAE